MQTTEKRDLVTLFAWTDLSLLNICPISCLPGFSEEDIAAQGSRWNKNNADKRNGRNSDFFTCFFDFRSLTLLRSSFLQGCQVFSVDDSQIEAKKMPTKLKKCQIGSHTLIFEFYCIFINKYFWNYEKKKLFFKFF